MIIEEQKDLHKILDLRIFGDYKLHIVLSDNILKARNKFSKQLDGRKVDESDTSWGGMHSYSDGCFYKSFIFLPYSARSSVIAHESFHATVRIMSVIGQELNSGSEESYAYLLDHIVEFITNIYLKLDK